MKNTTLSIVCCISWVTTFAQVSPLVSTTWNQGCYYNDQCPATGSGGACGKVWTGCNATAIAQIFKYYAYPPTGAGTHCNSNAPTNCVDFSAQAYNYAAMPNNVASANTEVAKLMYHLGIAVDMQWSGSSSNSFFASEPMKRYFKYSPRMYGTATFVYSTTADLIAALKAELDAGRPIYAKSNTLNHFYLIDGYNASDLFHCNFGWGGTYNGYYTITNVSTGAGNATPTNFIFNIKPLDGDLETAKDTIVVPATANAGQVIEFTSLLNWTMSKNVPWVNLNLSSGNSGYFNSADGSTFSTTINNGPVRYGYIYIQNANDTDTIVVKQDTSALVVTPQNLNYNETGGSQDLSVAWYSWSTWNASTPDSWISVSPLSGTGNGTITITCANNPVPAARNGIVVVTGGAFTDSIYISQDANSTTGIDIQQTIEEKVRVYPNPTRSGKISLVFTEKTNVPHSITLYNILGNTLTHYKAFGNNPYEINLEYLTNGLYILEIDAIRYKLIKE